MLFSFKLNFIFKEILEKYSGINKNLVKKTVY